MYYLKRVKQLGAYGLVQTIKYRFVRWSFAQRYRPRGLVNQSSCPRKTHLFYGDITIPSHKNAGLATLHPDIKTWWDEARLHRLSVIGTLFGQTGDQCYVDEFQHLVTSWIHENPYLMGVNWVCTMEVAIRAINLVEGATYFRDALVSPRFWLQLRTSLLQHADYIKHHWEWSDKPNNHYLADLLGYLYLCFFFKDVPSFVHQQQHIMKRFLAQWQQQINADGTAYEGSTAYHRLDTEMMMLFINLSEKNNVSLPSWVYEMYRKMNIFLEDCTDEQGNFVMIGDDDSGKVIDGVLPVLLVREASHTHCIKTYPDFGLTIIKKAGWHITFRHPTFHQRQPTGHFHQDVLSVTVGIDGIPIFVDPGSYVYTANGAWRNKFRSWESHTTFFNAQHDGQALAAHDLFQLPRQSRLPGQGVRDENDVITVRDDYQEGKTTYARELVFNPEKACLQLHDTVATETDVSVKWRFILHPHVTVQQESEHQWLVMHQRTKIAWLESSLILNRVDSFYAPSYGVKLQTSALTGTALVRERTKVTAVLNRA